MDKLKFDHRLLIRLRVEREWSAQKAATELGISTTALVNLETGAVRPRSDTLLKIARLYGVRMDDFYPSRHAVKHS